MSEPDNSLLGLLKRQGARAIDTHKIPQQPMTEREAQKSDTVATDRQGETPERSGQNDLPEIPGFLLRGLVTKRQWTDELNLDPPRMANRPPDYRDPVNAPSDPGPGVADVERFQALCQNASRMDTQAPEAPIPLDPLALDPVDALQLERIEIMVDERAAAMAQRDSLLEHVKELEWQVTKLRIANAALEADLTTALCPDNRAGAREVTLAAALRASRRTINLLICIGGSVLAVESLALAGMAWRMIP